MTYTQRYVGSGGSDANDGSTVALRKLTLQAMENALSAATRYTVNVRQGTYRELLTLGVSGPTAYATGTISVTLGSKTVTGSGTAWLANAELNDWLQVQVLASGTDGVTSAVTATSHTFTSAAGNFQAGHVGYSIRINTIGAYIITAVASATSITIAKPDNSSFLMVAGTGLTYNVGPESPYKVASVDSDTQITLAEAWGAPTFTGLAYQVWGHVEYVGDYTGVIFGDSFGAAPVRITGSDNDQTATRASCITATTKLYRTFTGFALDFTTGGSMLNFGTSCTNIIVSKSTFQAMASANAYMAFSGTGIANSVLGCVFFTGRQQAVLFTNGATVNNVGGLIQNCAVFGFTSVMIDDVRVGGITVRNCVLNGSGGAGNVRVATALAVGQTVTVNNCILANLSTALNATVAGEITEDYNTFFGNGTDRTNTLSGANSKTYAPLFDPRWAFQLMHAQAAAQLISPWDLASFSQLVNLAGILPTATDLRGQAILGAQREWGALEYNSALKITGDTQSWFVSD